MKKLIITRYRIINGIYFGNSTKGCQGYCKAGRKSN